MQQQVLYEHTCGRCVGWSCSDMFTDSDSMYWPVLCVIWRSGGVWRGQRSDEIRHAAPDLLIEILMSCHRVTRNHHRHSKQTRTRLLRRQEIQLHVNLITHTHTHTHHVPRVVYVQWNSAPSYLWQNVSYQQVKVTSENIFIRKLADHGAMWLYACCALEILSLTNQLTN